MAIPNPSTSAQVPGPAGLPLLGSALDFRRLGMFQMYQHLWQQHGDAVRVRVGPLTQYLFVQPSAVQHVLVDNQENYCKGLGYRKVKLLLGEGLVTSEGNFWRRQRRLMQPPFTPKNVTQFAPTMVATTAEMAERWATYAAHDETVNVRAEMMRLAMQIIARVMFSRDIEADAQEAGTAFAYVLESITSRAAAAFELPAWIPTRDHRQFNQALRILDTFMYRMIREHQDRGSDTNDLLGQMLASRDPETGAAMNPQQLRDEVLTVFFAGHETTAQALTWTWLLLDQHPAQAATLHAELDRVLGTGSERRLPTVADLHNLPYTTMVVQESMRLYPPVWIFVRDAIKDDEVDGYRVPAGAMLVFSPYLTQRHPAFWEQPNEFRPERFAPEASAGRPRYAYFPFAAGPRICLGNNFALIEAVLVIATLAHRFAPQAVPGQSIRPRMAGTLRPDHDVLMQLQPR